MTLDVCQDLYIPEKETTVVHFAKYKKIEKEKKNSFIDCKTIII